MNQPDKKPNTESTFVPNEGQRRFLSGDKRLSRCPSLSFQTKEEMIKSFQDLYKSQYGEEISYDEALEQGMNLIAFITQMNPELQQLKNHV